MSRAFSLLSNNLPRTAVKTIHDHFHLCTYAKIVKGTTSHIILSSLWMHPPFILQCPQPPQEMSATIAAFPALPMSSWCKDRLQELRYGYSSRYGNFIQFANIIVHTVFPPILKSGDIIRCPCASGRNSRSLAHGPANRLE